MTTADAIRELLAAWNKIEAAVLASYPSADSETRYQIASAAMRKALRL